MIKILLIFLTMCGAVFSLEIKDSKVYDDYGNSIKLKEYKKIVVYNYGVVEILYKLKSQDEIVAIGNHRNSIWPEEKTKDLPLAGPISKPSVEKILSFNPDLVIFNVMGNKVDELKKIGVPSLIYSNKSLENIIGNIEVLGRLTNKKKESLKVANELEKQLNSLKNKEKLKGKVLILYSTNPPSSFSKDSLPVEILELLGLNVITPSFGKKSIISSEYVLSENPDIIIGTRGVKNIDDIKKAIPLIEETKAFKNNKIYKIDSNILLRGSHRVFDEIEKVYKKLK